MEIPGCFESVCGASLRSAMIVICIINILVSLLTADLFFLIIFIIILNLVVLGDKIPAWVHLVFNVILWLRVIFYTLGLIALSIFVVALSSGDGIPEDPNVTIDGDNIVLHDAGDTTPIPIALFIIVAVIYTLYYLIYSAFSGLVYWSYYKEMSD